ncbi:MAG: FAD:protein FMN transferase, partial [Eubacterium sp.]|nr:FAD:protein FMN transferase [Eubacterium sp.]
SKGWNDYAISIGGNVITSGFKDADGTKWNIQLENPDKNAAPDVVCVSGEAVVTSGDYQRFYEYNGKKYCHIINPETLMPANAFTSVSVITKNDSALADTLSTALFILPLSEGRKLIESIDGAEALWVEKSGKSTYSAGFKGYIKK